MFIQLITPNPDVPCTPGLCLVYVQSTFNIGAKYPSAIAAWNASQTQHTDYDFPDNVWVAVWFSLSNNEFGHVALRAPDGSIYSSSHPTSTTPTHHDSLIALELYYGGRLQYLGWTEDVEDVKVIGETMTNEQATYLAQRIGLLAGMSETEITANWLDYHATNITADPNYAAALAKQLYDGSQWQLMAYKSGHYDKDLKAAAGDKKSLDKLERIKTIVSE